MQDTLMRQLMLSQIAFAQGILDTEEELEKEWAKAALSHIEVLESLQHDVSQLFRALQLAHGLIIDMDDRGELDEDDETSDNGREFLAITSILSNKTIYEEVS